MLFFWRKARSQHNESSGTCQQAVPEVPVVPEIEGHCVPERVAGIVEWTAPDVFREIETADHVGIVIRGLQDCGLTGYVPGMTIHRIYPEIAWIAGVEPLTRRQLDLVLSAALPKQKRRGRESGALLVHYLIPDVAEPEAVKKPKPKPQKSGTVVAFASPKFGSQSSKSQDLALKAKKMALKPKRRARGTARAAA